MNTYVLDTSVIVKWFSQTDEEDLKQALCLRDDYLHEQCLLVIPAPAAPIVGL